MKNEEFDVIRRILAGNTQEYESLVRNYQAAVYNVLYQMLQQHEEAEELAQDVFVKAYEKLNTYNFQSKFFSWIYRIAINTAISHQKKAQRFMRLERLPEATDHNENSNEGQMIEKERDAILKQAIGKAAFTLCRHIVSWPVPGVCCNPVGATWKHLSRQQRYGSYHGCPIRAKAGFFARRLANPGQSHACGSNGDTGCFRCQRPAVGHQPFVRHPGISPDQGAHAQRHRQGLHHAGRCR